MGRHSKQNRNFTTKAVAGATAALATTALVSPIASAVHDFCICRAGGSPAFVLWICTRVLACSRASRTKLNVAGRYKGHARSRGMPTTVSFYND